MKKGSVRITVGIVLIILQALSLWGNAKVGIYPSISFSSPTLFLYDLISLISYFFVGILGVISFVSGIIASRRGEKEVASTAASTSDSSDSVCSALKDCPSTSRQRYCRFCGGEIDADTKKCTKCGKQYFRWRSSASVLLPWIVSFISVICLFGCYLQIQDNMQEISEQTGLIIEQQSVIDSNQLTIVEFQRQIVAKNDRSKELVSANNRFKTILQTIRSQYVYVADGSKYYHKDFCIDLDISNFSLLTPKSAKQKGLKPCQLCLPN